MIDPREKQAYLTASPHQREVVRRSLLNVLACLRAQYLSYQTSHWVVVGQSSYGNHLLFQRLYESVQLQIDELAEKIIGYLGTDAMSLTSQMKIIEVYCTRWYSIHCNHRRGIQSEEDLQTMVKMAYDSIKGVGAMTLGLDDWLMATANAHETNAYLLQQSLAEPAPEKDAEPEPESTPIPIYAAARWVKDHHAGFTTRRGLPRPPAVSYEWKADGMKHEVIPEWFWADEDDDISGMDRWILLVDHDYEGNKTFPNARDAMRWAEKAHAQGRMAQGPSTVAPSAEGAFHLPIMASMWTGRKFPHQRLSDRDLARKGGAYIKGLPESWDEALAETGTGWTRKDMLYAWTSENFRGLIDMIRYARTHGSQLTSGQPGPSKSDAEALKEFAAEAMIREAIADNEVDELPEFLEAEANSRSASGAPSAEGAFHLPESSEVRDFADTGAISNNPEIAAEASVEDNLDVPAARAVAEAQEAPPTPTEIAAEPGGETVSTLNRFVVDSLEPTVPPASDSGRSLMARWIAEVRSASATLVYEHPDKISPLNFKEKDQQFDIFASDIRGSFLSGVTIKNPRTGKSMRFSNPKVFRDRENEITHWVLQGDRMLTLLVWND